MSVYCMPGSVLYALYHIYSPGEGLNSLPGDVFTKFAENILIAIV